MSPSESPAPLPPTALWDCQAPLQRIRGGHRNRAFRTQGAEPQLIFKSTRRSEAALAWLAPVHDAAEAAGFAVPRLLPSRNGRLCEAGWTCEAWIEGRSFPAAGLPRLRAALETLHAACAGLPQRPGFASARELLARESGGDIRLSALPREAAAACREAWHALTHRRETAIHGDLNPGNLLRCPDGRTALLDWDESRRDLALFDLGQLGPVDSREWRAILAWEVACCWELEPAHAEKLLKQL
ncbi:phosphotransferase [Poseidonocella sp. HB161398]|uniref:phosphotransferase n=1 Tax=Poseidonocella sp. HB161398 TaxID=2320855 RepID=UPI0011083D19|nr:phosphotransferase [Poseidonocella sp. HB161398]